MNNNVLRTALEWGLITSLLFSVIFLVQYSFRAHNVRTLQPQLQNEMFKIQNNRTVTQSLVGECMEYRKNNPSIDPVLRSLGIIPTEPTPGKPAGK